MEIFKVHFINEQGALAAVYISGEISCSITVETPDEWFLTGELCRPATRYQGVKQQAMQALAEIPLNWEIIPF